MKKNKKEKLLVEFGNYILNREVINPENENCVTDADLQNFFATKKLLFKIISFNSTSLLLDKIKKMI